MIDCYLMDLDGTLADCSHRIHYIMSKPKNWKALFAGIPFDTLIEPVAREFRKAVDNKIPVIIVTARSQSTELDTLMWLKEKNMYHFEKIYFRKLNDFRNDDIVKKEILDEIRKEGYNPIKAFEDRPRIIRMYREQGIETIDCGNGVEF